MELSELIIQKIKLQLYEYELLKLQLSRAIISWRHVDKAITYYNGKRDGAFEMLEILKIEIYSPNSEIEDGIESEIAKNTRRLQTTKNALRLIPVLIFLLGILIGKVIP